MSSACRMVAEALGAQAHGGENALCGFCGGVAPARASESVLKENFTNRDELISPWVCWACEACLNAAETRSSHLVTRDGQFRRIERREVWPMLLAPPEPPFALYLTLSGKKHGLFRQSVAESRVAFRLQCEDLSGWYVVDRCSPWMREALALRRLGVRRVSLETGRYFSSDWLKCRDAIKQFEGSVAGLRASQLFTILLGTMPGEKDIIET